MSLITKNTKPTLDREELTTESALIENQRIETRAYQKAHRMRTLAAYNKEKIIIDNLSSDKLTDYVTSNTDSSHDVRTGLHSMKVNSYEHAVIKKAIEVTGSKGSRDLYINLCKQLINDTNK